MAMVEGTKALASVELEVLTLEGSLFLVFHNLFSLALLKYQLLLMLLCTP